MTLAKGVDQILEGLFNTQLAPFLNKIYKFISYVHCCPPFTSGVCPFTLLMAWMADAAAVKLGAWLLKHNGLKTFFNKTTL